jgi:hypothetical protein
VKGKEPLPRFTVGDPVIVTGPGAHRGRKGVVIEVIEPRAVVVYRYRVSFAEGSPATFFGFELLLEESSPGAAAA